MNDDVIAIADECVKLNKFIKESTKKFEALKKDIKNKMIKNNLDVINGKNYKIRHTVYKNKYSTSLPEEFKNLGANIIGDLIKDDLISISYSLNLQQYQSLKKVNKKSALDSFVQEKKAKSFIYISQK